MRIHKPPKMAVAKFFGLFYGLTDSGKTYLLGSAQECPETSPCLFINVDGGDLTLSGSDIHVVDVTNFEELQEVFDFLKDENTEYKSACFDSLTAQQRDVSMPAVLESGKRAEILQDLSRVKPPQQYDWLASGQQMKNLLGALKSLTKSRQTRTRIHVFMAAGERVDERRDLGVPALPGILGLETGGYVDILGRMVHTIDEESNKEVRYLYTVKHAEDDGFTYLGKNRGRRLPRRVKDPSISKLMRYWHKEPGK